jgi:hypothetical protein
MLARVRQCCSVARRLVGNASATRSGGSQNRPLSDSSLDETRGGSLRGPVTLAGLDPAHLKNRQRANTRQSVREEMGSLQSQCCPIACSAGRPCPCP